MTSLWKQTVLLTLAATSSSFAQHPLSFDIRLLTVDANEGCTIADFDGDGRLDVAAGRNWYRNGDWAPRSVRSFGDVNDYAASNCDFAMDVNEDGRIDIVAGGFFDPVVRWYENPGPERSSVGLQWTAHELADTGLKTNEASFLHDLDGDGAPEWITNQWNPENPLIVWRFARQDGKPVLQPTMIGPKNGHGIGFGDINNDGRDDILVGAGWYERPKGDWTQETWTFHPDWNRPFSCPMYVRDIDRDGKNDLLFGNPHDFGLYLWKSRGVGADGKLQFEEVVVDRSFSQLHCIHFADLDGDGVEELLTGKRVRAHNGRDPGGMEPPEICYYAITSDGEFTKHTINRGEVGIGLQIRTADLDADGDLDIVVAGKEGTQVLFNRLR